MTRLMPRTNMGSSGSSAASSSSASAGAKPGSGTGLLSPPPRAALSGNSSPAPDDPRNRDGASPAGVGKDTATQAGSTANVAATGTGANVTPTTTTQSASPGSPAALQRLLKERDARIASLERELEMMEMESTRELNKRSTAESETATTFWQAKHGVLSTAFLRTDTDVRLLRDEARVRSDERHELRAAVDGLRRQLMVRDDEARELRAQVRGLKEWVSNSTRTDGQAKTSDEVFGTAMARLGNELQNWVIVNFRRSRLDLKKAPEAVIDDLCRLVPMCEDLAMTAKIYLLQSIVSRVLVELVFEAYFVGLSPAQAEQFAQIEALLGSFAASPEPINQWRSLTLAILKKDCTQTMQDETARLTDAIVTRVNGLLGAITDTTATEARDQGLRALVGGAVDLARLLVVQKAVFSVFMPEIMPHQRVTFDSATMEDLGGEEDDEDGLAEREICCVAFPGITKRGDENGGHLQYTNVIAKARVLCSLD